MEPDRARLAAAVYALLLRAYPARFRDAYGADATTDFTHLYREARQSGMRAMAGLWRRTVTDVISNGLSERSRERKPDSGRENPMDRVRQELRQAVRALIRTPTFTVATIGILALSIGAVTTIFSIVYHVVLRPLPYPDQDRLYQITKRGSAMPLPDLLDVQQRTNVFDRSGAFWTMELAITGRGTPYAAQTSLVTPGLFETLGAAPALGRLFSPDDFTGDGDVAVLSHDLWRQRFGADPAVVGQTLTIGGTTLAIIGVLDPAFRAPELFGNTSAEVWAPFGGTSMGGAGGRLIRSGGFSGFDPLSRRMFVLTSVGVLREDIAPEAASAELDALSRALAAEYPENVGRDGEPSMLSIRLLHEVLVGDVRQPLLVLLGSVGLMLLIACANVANLFLARGADRRREIALRAALGASRGRIMSQFLTEALVLALGAGALGIAMAAVCVNLVRALATGIIPRLAEVGVDWRVAGFAFALSASTGVLFWIAPALRSSRPDVQDSLKEGSLSTTATRGQFRLRGMLVAAEVALALMLLSGAGLLFNSFLRLSSVDPGFETSGIVVQELSLADGFSEPGARTRFLTELTESLQGQPGIVAVTGGIQMPFRDGGCCWRSNVLVPGGTDTINAWGHPVLPGYFDVLQARFAEGGPWSAADVPVNVPALLRSNRNTPASGAIPVVISRVLAERLFGEEPAVGRNVRFSFSDSVVMTITGVLDGVRTFSLGDSLQPEVYVPYQSAEAVFPMAAVGVRYHGDGDAVGRAIQQAVWRIRSDLPLPPPLTMEDRVAATITTPRFYSTMFVAFAGVAFLLAAGGIYASMLYAVGTRRREMGIRLALGATGTGIQRMVLGQGMRVTAIGVVIGLAGALSLSRLLTSFLFGIGAQDPLTISVATALLSLVAAAACYLPARRAAQSDPMLVLRSD